MLQDLRDALHVVARAARELDADGLRGPDAAALFEDVVAGGRGIDALKALLARRVDETGSYRGDGCQSAAAWIAQKSGSTFAAAETTLTIGMSLDAMPEVADAVRGGELSVDQAKVVVDVARKVPEAAGESRVREAPHGQGTPREGDTREVRGGDRRPGVGRPAPQEPVPPPLDQR